MVLYEMTELALVLITFLILAFDSLKGESIIVELVVSRFPRRARDITAVVIYFLAIVMLGILSRQLIIQAMRVQGYGQTTPMLGVTGVSLYIHSGLRHHITHLGLR